MKAVIFAGGLGTRISEETDNRPKPMVNIGGMPIIWHILKLYSSHNINDFVICCGYKGFVIKEYFANYFLHTSDVTFDLKNNKMEVHNQYSEPWKVTLVDTGLNTMTGGRLKQIFNYVKDDNSFCLTYGDGLSDVNISKLISFHKTHGKKATLTAVSPPGRFGVIDINKDQKITCFREKPNVGGMVNGGFFVLSPEVIGLVKSDSTVWEREPLELLANQSELMAYEHHGFWQPMDTLRDKNYLEKLWASGNAPWKTW
jgi:glucose-1-phosphate cytidylyltransferase